MTNWRQILSWREEPKKWVKGAWVKVNDPTKHHLNIRIPDGTTGTIVETYVVGTSSTEKLLIRLDWIYSVPHDVPPRVTGRSDGWIVDKKYLELI